jgi:predicted transcriptional regulator
VEQCMTQPAIVITEDASVEELTDTMEQHQVRRVLVVDHNHCCCGIVSQADVARHASAETTAEVVEEISR